MFFIKKLITPLILPPGIIIIALLAAGLWFLYRKRRRHIATACLATCAVLWFCSNNWVAHGLMRQVESGLRLPTELDADVIIMLGGGLRAKAPDLSGTGAPGPHTMERMVTAARLNRRTALPIIVSGGAVFKNSGAVARVTRRFLQDLGISETDIIVEALSRDTYENAYFSAKICRQYGFKRPLLVTSAYHMKRSIIAFEKIGLPVTPYPCAITTWPNQSLSGWHLLPSAGALHTVSTVLHEWIGTIYYQLKY